MTELELRVRVAAPAETVFAAMTDWSRQGEWMPGTTTRVTGGDGMSTGSGLAAFTGVGPLGFTDTMRITVWQPPLRCEVRHTGTVVRGSGVFAVERLTARTSRFTWIERLDLPLGAAGRLGWPLVRPAARLGLRWALERFARFAERYGEGER